MAGFASAGHRVRAPGQRRQAAEVTPSWASSAAYLGGMHRRLAVVGPGVDVGEVEDRGAQTAGQHPLRSPVPLHACDRRGRCRARRPAAVGESGETHRSPEQPIRRAIARHVASCPCAGPTRACAISWRIVSRTSSSEWTRGQRRAQPEGLLGEMADPGPPLGVVVGHLPVVEAVHLEEVLGHREGVTQVHAQHATTRHRRQIVGHADLTPPGRSLCSSPAARAAARVRRPASSACAVAGRGRSPRPWPPRRRRPASPSHFHSFTG